jgi:hypothetical protein
VAFADVVEPPPDECLEGTRPSVSHAGPVCWARECGGENAVTTCDGSSTCQPRAYCVRDVVDYRNNLYPDAMGPCDAQGRCATSYDRCAPADPCIVTGKTLQLCVEGTAAGGTGGALGTGGATRATGGSAFVATGGAATTGGAANVYTRGGSADPGSGGTNDPGATGGRAASAGTGTTGGSLEGASKKASDESGCGCRLGAALLVTAGLACGRRRARPTSAANRR